MSAASFDEIKRKYNFKDISVTPWRDPSLSVLPSRGGPYSPHLSTEKTFIPTYKVNHDLLSESTDEEVSEVGEDDNEFQPEGSVNEISTGIVESEDSVLREDLEDQVIGDSFAEGPEADAHLADDSFDGLNETENDNLGFPDEQDLVLDDVNEESAMAPDENHEPSPDVETSRDDAALDDALRGEQPTIEEDASMAGARTPSDAGSDERKVSFAPGTSDPKPTERKKKAAKGKKKRIAVPIDALPPDVVAMIDSAIEGSSSPPKTAASEVAPVLEGSLGTFDQPHEVPGTEPDALADPDHEITVASKSIDEDHNETEATISTEHEDLEGSTEESPMIVREESHIVDSNLVEIDPGNEPNKEISSLEVAVDTSLAVEKSSKKKASKSSKDKDKSKKRSSKPKSRPLSPPLSGLGIDTATEIPPESNHDTHTNPIANAEENVATIQVAEELEPTHEGGSENIQVEMGGVDPEKEEMPLNDQNELEIESSESMKPAVSKEEQPLHVVEEPLPEAVVPQVSMASAEDVVEDQEAPTEVASSPADSGIEFSNAAKSVEDEAMGNALNDIEPPSIETAENEVVVNEADNKLDGAPEEDSPHHESDEKSLQVVAHVERSLEADVTDGATVIETVPNAADEILKDDDLETSEEEEMVHATEDVGIADGDVSHEPSSTDMGFDASREDHVTLIEEHLASGDEHVDEIKQTVGNDSIEEAQFAILEESSEKSKAARASPKSKKSRSHESRDHKNHHRERTDHQKDLYEEHHVSPRSHGNRRSDKDKALVRRHAPKSHRRLEPNENDSERQRRELVQRREDEARREEDLRTRREDEEDRRARRAKRKEISNQIANLKQQQIAMDKEELRRRKYQDREDEKGGDRTSFETKKPFFALGAIPKALDLTSGTSVHKNTVVRTRDDGHRTAREPSSKTSERSHGKYAEPKAAQDEPTRDTNPKSPPSSGEQRSHHRRHHRHRSGDDYNREDRPRRHSSEERTAGRPRSFLGGLLRI